MIKTITIFKRGAHLTGTVYKDTVLLNCKPFFAEVINDKQVSRSPHFIDEDTAMSWIEEQFEDVISRKLQRRSI